MTKNKKIYKYTLIPLLVIFLLLTISFLSSMSPSVQTYLGKKVMSRISSNLRGEIGFSAINLTFFNRLTVSDFLVMDYDADTLLYSPYFQATLRKFNRKENSIRLGRITIESPQVYLHTDTAGKLNASYFFNSATPGDTSNSSMEMSIDQMRIYNGTLRFDNNNSHKQVTSGLDLNHINIRNLNLIMDDFDRKKDKTSLTLSELSLDTPEGFRIYDLFAEADISKDHIYLVDPTIRSSYSLINSDLIGIDMVHNDSTVDFVRDARLNLKFNRSLLGIRDIGFFVGNLDGFDQSVTLSGDIKGTVSELKGRHIDLSYSDMTRLKCDFDLSGLPDIAQTFIFVDIDQLSTHTSEIEAINIPGKGNIDLGPEFSRLGNLGFKGNFTGFVTDFVTYGDFTTDLGTVSTDILFSPDTSNSFIYNGSLQAVGVDLGTILDRPDLLGRLSFTANIDGSSESFDRFRANLEGTIDSLYLNGYDYRSIALKGLFTEKIWDGSIISDSPDLRMDVLGRFDFSNGPPEFDFTLNLLDANLHALNLDPADSVSRLSMLLTASFKGSKIDDANGDIRLLNSRLNRNGKTFDLYDCSLTAINNDEINSLELNSDFVDGSISGKYDLRNILSDVKTVGARLMPAWFIKEGSVYHLSSNRFDCDLSFKQTDELNDFFNTGIYLAPGSRIRGTVDPDSLISLSASSDYFTYNGNSMVDIGLRGEINDTSSDVVLTSSKVSLANRIELQNFNTELSSLPDNLRFELDWANPGNLVNRGTVKATGQVTSRSEGAPLLSVNILPSEITINNNLWNIEKAGLMIDSTAIDVNGFEILHKNDFLMVDGKISQNRNDTLFMSFNNLDLSALNNLKKQDAEAEGSTIDFFVSGLLDGKVMLTDIYNNLLFETDMQVRDFKTNDHDHGLVKLITSWDNRDKVVQIDLRNDLDGQNTFDINGTYNPGSKQVSIVTDVSDLPLDLLNLVLYSFASDVTGKGNGRAYITGTPSDLKINGSIMANDAGMTIDYLKSRFYFSDSIRLGGNSFIFNNIALNDNKGNKATLDGVVTNDHFRDFGINLRINVDNMLVMDTREKDNNLFYGTAYASGLATITGNTSNLVFNVSATTGRNTRMFIPLNTSEEVSDYPYITFVSHTTESDKPEITVPPLNTQVSNTTMELGFDLDVTPDAEVQLVFDSQLGDIMRARGTGKLNLAMDKDGNFNIFGDYIIEDGDYLLTLGNIFNKRFTVESGGRISWNGDVTDADINIKAIYKLKASLYDLFQDEAFRARIPVECHLNMTGKLANPVIGFDIYLPTADEETRTYLKNMINTEEEMSKQFLYLLVMNSFYPDPTFAGAMNTTTAGAEAMGVTTTEMLSNQLSNWLSQISNDFDIGFTYRPGNEVSSQEVEVALSTQLLNDRVVINGNFDVGGQESTSTTKDITGDFNVEVKLTEKVRFKVFNRSNDNILYETAPYTQGFGLFFRKDFNHFREIFRKDKSKMKKEEDPEAVEVNQ